VSISIYLFSRIVSTTTVSSLRSVLFLCLLPLPPHCLFFILLPLHSLQFLSFAVRLRFAFAVSFSPANSDSLFSFLSLPHCSLRPISIPLPPPLSSFARSPPLCYSLLPLLLSIFLFSTSPYSLFPLSLSLSFFFVSFSFTQTRIYGRREFQPNEITKRNPLRKKRETRCVPAATAATSGQTTST
jgi:hypothetical protein